MFLLQKTRTFCEELLKKKSDEKKKANQTCEDQEQMFVVVLGANDHTTYNWIINSSITQHMTFEWKWFRTYKSIVSQKVNMSSLSCYLVSCIFTQEHNLQAFTCSIVHDKLSFVTHLVWLPYPHTMWGHWQLLMQMLKHTTCELLLSQ